ncbi:Uncharacterized ABC transporter ATP-binding protein YfmR [Durusdinium trenchii]|uniref:Uncharacterized ABC transporter ATP-binding protein YfmR n=1 Tax=Durusdinium trenchii TaxID=1381693 RepID=A0ABP0I9K9_9DINO
MGQTTKWWLSWAFFFAAPSFLLPQRPQPRRHLTAQRAVLEIKDVRGTHDELRTLFQIEELKIEKGRKVAVVGANGCGKSTLLSYLSGQATPREGSVRLKPRAHITIVEHLGCLGLGDRQNPTFDAKKTVLDTIYEKSNSPVARAAHDFRAACALGGEALSKAMDQMDAMPEAWTWDEQVAEVAEELGLSTLLQRPVGTLSGGEERRVALAAALVDLPQTDARAWLGALDGFGDVPLEVVAGILTLEWRVGAAEAHVFMCLKLQLQRTSRVQSNMPTNHLSAEGCDFLQEKLRAAKDLSLVLVSHDRYFLDRVCDEIFEIDWNGETFLHPGSWASFLERRAQRYETRAGQVQDAKVQLRRAEEWARRGASGRGTKNKAGGPLTLRLRNKAKAVVAANDGTPDLQNNLLKGKALSTSSSGLVGRVVLQDIVVEVPNRRVLNNISVCFEKGEKVGVVGPNGAGKSTLLKTLVGDIEPNSGEVFIGQGVLIGCLSQTPKWPDPNRRVIEVVSDMATVAMTQADDGVLGRGAESMSLQRRRAAMLKAVNFAESRWSTPVGMLSGGENRRLQLLRVLVERPNVLLLDEPTNDLDAVTVDSLESMLQRYPGTVVLVSHDRSLLDGVCGSFLVMQEDGSQPMLWTGSFHDLLVTQHKKQKASKNPAEEKETKLAADKADEASKENLLLLPHLP